MEAARVSPLACGRTKLTRVLVRNGRRCLAAGTSLSLEAALVDLESLDF